MKSYLEMHSSLFIQLDLKVTMIKLLQVFIEGIYLVTACFSVVVL